MASTNFIRFFDKLGNDANFSEVYDDQLSLYTGVTSSIVSYEGRVFFPKVSIGLIESQQLFLLEEVTGPTSSFELRKVKGTAVVIGGNSTINGIDSDFTILQVGTAVKIGSHNFTVSSTPSATSFSVTPTPSANDTTSEIYFYDYLSYNELRSSVDTFAETLKVSIVEDESEFFLYDVSYGDSVPYIERSSSAEQYLIDGSTDTIDSLTGRVSLSTVTTLPNQINVGFSSTAVNYDDIYEQTLKLSLEKKYIESLASMPYSSSGDLFFTIGGTSHKLYETTQFFLQGTTASGATATFFEYELEIVSVGVSGSDTVVRTKTFDYPINLSNLSKYRLLWINDDLLATINLYGETESEDERFKLVLENFGKKIDFNDEYIFRDSDIYEELPDFRLLNKKRKELLLEGDNIYPYLGTYRALINIINFFGYYDLRIKEYFLNVDENSSNFGKYLHILIPRNSEQRRNVKDSWINLPSSIYKKTSLFGLFYDINRSTDQTDDDDVPIVEDAFDFSPEEVLIKLFGLKELLKKQFLPLNARIFDITGEGIYFELIKINSWSDNLNNIVVDVGNHIEFSIFPDKVSYISDVRRIDKFYVNKFIEQGFSGFIDSSVHDSTISAGSTVSISSLYQTYLYNYDYFMQTYGELMDKSWLYFPPGIDDELFNFNQSLTLPIADDENVISGAPILLEAFFNIVWSECSFSWDQISIFDPSGAPLNTYSWAWNSLGRGQYVDLQWTVSKNGNDGFFYDSGRRSIEDFLVEDRYLHAVLLPYEGTYEIGLYLYDITNNCSISFQSYEAKSWNVDFVSIHKNETSERTWEDFSKTDIEWKDIFTTWYYPIHIETMWKDANVSWKSLDYSSYDGTNLYEYSLDTQLLKIDRENEYVIMKNDLTQKLINGEYLDSNDYVFFIRDSSSFVQSNLMISIDDVGSFLQGIIGATQSDAIVSGATGATSVITTPYDTSSFVSAGDQLWLNGNWYTVLSTSSDRINLDYPLVNVLSSVKSLIYPSSGQVNVSFSTNPSVSMMPYSRIIASTVADYYSIDPTVDFYVQIDGLTCTSSSIVIDGSSDFVKNLLVENSSIGSSNKIYMTWGAYAGTYAIKIQSVTLFGNDTLIRFNDFNKELYNIDGNFTARLADYDVDYAESRIGPASLIYENMNETTWDDNSNVTWTGVEYHGGALCGFVIPTVLPGGSITIDENPSFVFSGNVQIDSSYQGLLVAADELNSSYNEGLSKYTYSVLPEVDIFIKNSSNSNLLIAMDVNVGDTTITLNGTPNNSSVKIPGIISVTISSGSISSATVDKTGWGYSNAPIITVSSPGGTGTIGKLSCSILNGKINSVSIVDAGSGYSITPSVSVENPVNFKQSDNWVWTGYEWIELYSISGTVLTLASSVNYSISASTYLLLPYQYHKQLFLNKDQFNQFYYFIHANAKNPSNEMLSYVNFDNGVQSEWVNHPNRTSTYPLRNSLYFLSMQDYSDLSNDVLYNKWVYEGSDYPPLSIDLIYSSDVASYESRIPYEQTTQSSFSYSDVKISSEQQKVSMFTPIVFSYDICKIPGKNNPVWTIENDDTQTIQVMSSEAELMWNFTKKGNYSVSLKLEDSNGNVSTNKKNSFIVI